VASPLYPLGLSAELARDTDLIIVGGDFIYAPELVTVREGQQQMPWIMEGMVVPVQAVVFWGVMIGFTIVMALVQLRAVMPATALL
jgi:hypothetical protein